MPNYFKGKLNLFVSLGPASRMTNLKNEQLKTIAKYISFVKLFVVDILGIYNFFGPNWIEEVIEATICKAIPELFDILLTGFDKNVTMDSRERINSYISHMPSGAGYRNFLHFAQLTQTDKFVRYDYGNSD